MPKFFVPETAITQSAESAEMSIRIVGEDAHHLTSVLRTRPGEVVAVCDSAGTEYETVFVSGGEIVLLRIVSMHPCETEPPYHAVVYQALAKGEKMDTVVQKAVETGASEIVPVVSSRCTVRLDAKDIPRKTERWQKIAKEAAKQSGRGKIPVVREPIPFASAIQEGAGAALPLFCYEGEGTVSLRTLTDSYVKPHDIRIFVGPEGGFSQAEAEEAVEGNWKLCGLGKRILRTETAALFVLAGISVAYEL